MVEPTPIGSTGAAALLTALAIAAVMVGVWDAYCLFSGDEGSTASSIVRQLIARWPILAFAAGVLTGHLFW